MESLKGFGTSAVNFVMGPGLIPQLLLTIVFFIVLQIILSILESIFGVIKGIDKQSTVLQKDTVAGPYTVPQNPLLSKQIFDSVNEPNGMEFSYSMYIFISPETFEAHSADTCGPGETMDSGSLKHIFHKGSKNVFPLMSPGIFCEGGKNTIRVYMNSSLKWDNYVSIPNVPVGKWFHLVIMVKGKYLDAYVNGNVAVRHVFDTIPKLNGGNVYIMTNQKFPKSTSVNTDFKVDGPMKGMVSKVKYYAYALNYGQIDALYREGPSKTIVSNTYTNVPPYLHDDWWVTRY